MDLITGLPIHPLINHAVAVLVPLAAIGALLVIFIPKLRGNYSPLVAIALLMATISAFIATQSGEALAMRVGLPSSHATQGERLSFVVFAFFLMFSLWFVLERSDKIKLSISSFLKKILKGLIPITAVTSFALTIIVGHSGAQATWKDRIEQSVVTELPQAATSTTPTPAADGSITLSIAEIKTHNSKSDCWSIIKGNVYDLTSFVKNHPGAQAVIANICGKDGTNAFSNQHSTQRKPNNILSSLLLGPVDDSISSQDGQKTFQPPAPNGGGHSEEEEEEESDED